MRKGIWLAAVLVAVAAPRLAGGQQASQAAQSSQSQDKQEASQSTTKTETPQPQSLADAARKARAAEKNAPKAPKVFTNDNIPTASTGVSVVGQAPAAATKESASSETKADGDKEGGAEAAWRLRFSDARHKVEQDKADLAVMQRELGELNLQYYPDPTKAMQQSVSRSDITKKQSEIDAKQKQLVADEQALSNLEDELRKAGGDPAWARE